MGCGTSRSLFAPGCAGEVMRAHGSAHDRLTMKPCAAADQAVQWQIDETEPVLIRNSVSHKCLARMANDRVSTAPCTGGKSQRWTLR